MRSPRRLILSAITLATAVSACGDGRDERAEREQANRAGAETAVRSYLAALMDKDSGEACSRFTPEYRRTLMGEYRDFARDKGIDDCRGLIDATTRATPSVTFEGKRLTRDSIAQVELKTRVVQSGEEFRASVTGRTGIQRYELETRGGSWLISDIQRLR